MLAAALASLLPVHGAAAQTAAVEREVPDEPPADAADPGAPPVELETVQVTGTRVKGGTVPSPVVVLDAERIREEGFHDLGEVVRSIPQNFTGGQNPGAASLNIAGAGARNQNVTGGSSLNLRGLGPDATLTLLNGRRMAYSTTFQTVDISAIPVEAVSRVEIVADGASAIYGSDAVAGVGNVVLKREYEGVTLGARYGAATEGGLGTREYTATAGTTWGSGGLIATYKDASVDPIRADDRDYTPRMTPPATLYPGSDLGSGLVSLHQSIGSRTGFTLDALRTRRRQVYDVAFPGLHMHAAPTTTVSFVAPAIEVFLGDSWSLSAGAAWGRDRHRQYQTRGNMITPDHVPALDVCYCNDSRVYEVGVEGPVASLAAGEARIAAGAGYRSNEFTEFNHMTALPSTQGSESSRFAYAELDIPLVSAANARAGVERLALTAAVRGEDYDTFGRVATPKLGLIYGPSADATFRASWGRSFKAPTLYERNFMTVVVLDPPEYYGGTGYPPEAAVMYFAGGNRDLEAERARTWSASAAFHPRALPGLEAELTLFHIDFTNRVKQPIDNLADALRNPAYRQFITDSPTAEEQQRLIDFADRFYNFTDLPYDPGNVVLLIDSRNINANRQTVRGLDLSGSWRFVAGAGELTLRGAASWMESTEQTRAGQDRRDLAGTLFNPPELRARLGAVWDRGGFTASGFANHIGGVTDTVAGDKGSSFTTVDLTLRYTTGRRDDARSGTQFELTAQNLFNRSPPLFMPVTDYAPPYDSTNYSAIGRYLGISVSRRF
ncbi:TonB-dependent receptor plug domain-containing protein [Luteimonas granuli]|uniref:TonB-dependent receptor n=1 Tax=Luteimonas granuli TaxID=1176533 RepID=A0A518N6N7_9GAMM|nr:TonB-dependent receptor [Luteimonas granuli]QDW67573.1 TonB-dependent receptor [Luteimonas granuli]